MQRTDWHDLSDTAREAVEAYTGPVLKAETATEGLNSAVAIVAHTADATVFIKGLRNDHPGVVTQQREAAINPYVHTVSPRMLWQTEADGWNLLGFEYLEGRHADYSPGSPDLPLVLDAMQRLARIPCPDIPLKHAEQRWSSYIDDPANRELLKGGALLHTDFNPLNILITPDNTAHIVDWAWPTLGAAWIDPACLVLRLMAAGHTPKQAEQWADQHPAWRAAASRWLDVFAAASSQMWTEISGADGQPWKWRMAEYAREWAGFRRSSL
jgi:hypothetical protein